MLQYVFGLTFDLCAKNKMIAALLMACIISWLTFTTYWLSPSLHVYKEQARLAEAVVHENKRGREITTQVSDGKMIYNKAEFDNDKQGVNLNRKSEADRYNALD